MKCDRCGSKIRNHESDEGKKLGFTGRSDYCSDCWTVVKDEIKRDSRASELLSRKYGITMSKVKNIRQRSINKTAVKPVERDGWKINDIIRQ